MEVCFQASLLLGLGRLGLLGVATELLKVGLGISRQTVDTGRWGLRVCGCSGRSRESNIGTHREGEEGGERGGERDGEGEKHTKLAYDMLL